MTTYYAEKDISGLSWLTLLKSLWSNPPVLVYIGIRKLLGLRFSATHATAKPEKLDLLEHDRLPADARKLLDPIVDDVNSLGFAEMFCARGRYIGDKKTIAVVLSNVSGTIWATASWFWIRVESMQTSRALLAFHSHLSDDRILHTGAAKPSPFAWATPPREELELLSPGAAAMDLLKYHEQRLAEQTAQPIIMNRETLAREVLENTRSGIDHMIEVGLLEPISEAEATALSEQ